ncbi:hypothetical protein LSTR_LSTR009546 [Laodelphax striatellus]|uniref:THAP-type domain-containing protein n=1 Tax=Laodelphax striatellus TaxID=195883 RepID=A0A482WTV3_LAOST|nr:hypothetical protein LSTR_LSTR009546 [Laodelphax striatellus]
MDKRTTVKGEKKLNISAKRKKRRLPPEVNPNRRRRIEEQTLPPEVHSSSQADIDSSDNTVSSQNFQPRKYEEDKCGPSTSSASLESDLQNSIPDSVNFDVATIVPPISIEPSLNNVIDTTPMRSSEGSKDVENNVWNNSTTRYEYPDLTVESDGRPPKDDYNIISGRFIVDGKHIVQELRSLDYHRYECEKTYWTPNKYHTICSEHFIEGKKSDAVNSPSYAPTIFASSSTTPKDNWNLDRHSGYKK